MLCIIVVICLLLAVYLSQENHVFLCRNIALWNLVITGPAARGARAHARRLLRVSADGVRGGRCRQASALLPPSELTSRSRRPFSSDGRDLIGRENAETSEGGSQSHLEETHFWATEERSAMAPWLPPILRRPQKSATGLTAALKGGSGRAPPQMANEGDSETNRYVVSRHPVPRMFMLCHIALRSTSPGRLRPTFV